MNDDQLLRYSRHILLDEVGIEGQRKLLAARVLVIGAGGLGSPAVLYLATAILAMLPPTLVVVLMQRWFVKGLVDTEK